MAVNQASLAKRRQSMVEAAAGVEIFILEPPSDNEDPKPHHTSLYVRFGTVSKSHKLCLYVHFRTVSKSHKLCLYVHFGTVSKSHKLCLYVNLEALSKTHKLYF